MPDLRDLPPDPFADEGRDEIAVDAAERLAREGVDPTDPRWDRIGGEPTLDDFDDAEWELGSCDDPTRAGYDPECGSGPFTRMLPWLSAIAVLVVLAMVATYVLR